MVRLAEMAGVDPAQALLDLNAWRTKSDAARATYATLRDLVSKSALGALAALVLLGGSGPAGAEHSGNGSTRARNSLYIMENL